MQKIGGVYYVDNIQVSDNKKVRCVKYANIEVVAESAYEFFKTNGYELLGDKIKLEAENSDYTIYAEDYAGNYSILSSNQE